MKSIVNAEQLRDALKKTFSACAKSSVVPGMENAHITFQGDTCTVTGTNLEQWCQVTIPARGDSFSFRFLNTKRAMTIFKHYSGDLSVELPGEKPFDKDWADTLTLRCGARVCTQDAAEAGYFHVPPEFQVTNTYQANADALYQRYKRIRYAMGDGERRLLFQCVQFQDNRMVTLDGLRLALSRNPSFQASGVFFVPQGAMDLLPVLGNTDCTLLVGEKHIAFEANGTRVVSRVPADEGLNLDAVIPVKSQEEHVMAVDSAIQDVQYLNEFVTHPERQAVRFSGSSMSLSTPVGTSSVTLELREPLETTCGFNARFMLEGLKQFKAKKTQEITIGLTSPVSPILLTDGDGDLALILPMRLKDAASAA